MRVAFSLTWLPAAMPGTGMTSVLFAATCLRKVSFPLLTTYTFNTGTARHLFCSVCGIKSIYVPRSHPDGFSVNARCIDSPAIEEMTVRHINGREWEKAFPAGRGEAV